MTTTLTWTPGVTPSVSPIVFETGDLALYRLRFLGGLDPVALAGYSTKGPGQQGVTMLDIIVPPRIVPVQGLVQTDDADSLWTALRQLAVAFTQQPVRYGEEFALGTLLLERSGFGDREIRAKPRSLETRPTRAPGIATLDAEWECPYPWWQNAADSTVTIDDGASEVAANAGDVDAPIVAQLWGPFSDAILTNEATGEAFTITQDLTATDYVEVDTTPGHQSVELVDSLTGDRSNLISALNLADAVLWLLRPGNTSVGYAATGGSGATHAVVSWRNRYGGV